MGRRAKLGVLLLALLVLLSSCKKKKPPVPPPQEQAPTISMPTPPPLPEALPPPPPAPSVEKPAAAPKPKVKTRKKVAKKVTPPPAPPVEEKKTTVRDGGATSGTQLAADLPQNEAIQQRQSTVQLLSATDANLNQIGKRSLSGDEQAMVQQIRAYMQQSRAAAADGDTERAYTLAYKAHLLSTEMVKR